MIPTFNVIVFAVVVLPLLAVGVTALERVFSERSSEKLINLMVPSMFLGNICLLLLFGFANWQHWVNPVTLNFGPWFHIGESYFNLSFMVDRTIAVIALLSAFTVGLVGYYSSRYLHKEDGYARFFMLLCLFYCGINIINFGATLDLVVVGWEFIGISSVMLICFYQYRIDPVRNSFRVFIYYRLSDAGLLIAAVMAHEVFGVYTFNSLVLGGAVPQHLMHVHLVIGMVLFSSLIKSAQFPFSHWLPRAMEGPTPSSAIFYGALSIHAGPILILKMYPLFESFAVWRYLIGGFGLASAVYAALCGRTRADIKTILSYACISQVGLIYVEIALGLKDIALWHIAGHCLIRCWQFLNAPSIFHEVNTLNLGTHRQPSISKILPRYVQEWFFVQSYTGFKLEARLERLLVIPLIDLLVKLGRLEQHAHASVCRYIHSYTTWSPFRRFNGMPKLYKKLR